VMAAVILLLPMGVKSSLPKCQKQNMDAEVDVSEQRRHHEIYLSDPRKVAAEKMKTVLRVPAVKKV